MITLSFGALGMYNFLFILFFRLKHFTSYDFLVYLYESSSQYQYYSDACCCSLWFGYGGCGCNMFGCNCDYANDDYCYYSPVGTSGIVPHEGYCRLPTCRSTERCSSVTLNDGVC